MQCKGFLWNVNSVKACFGDEHDDGDGDGVKEFYLDSLYIFQFGMLSSESINAIWKYKMNNSLKL